MALTFAHKLWETTNVWSTTVGLADLPATCTVGAFNVGDMVIYTAAGLGQPWGWTVTSATGNPVVTLTWGPITIVGADGTGSIRFITAAATISPGDSVVETVSACALTLPTSYPTAKPITIIGGATTTVTPASGTIVYQGTVGTTQAAITLSAVQTWTGLSDGTNWVRY